METRTVPSELTSDIRGLIREAAGSGITLSVDGDRLRYQSLRGEMPPKFRMRLQSRRAGLIAELSRPRFRKGTSARRILPFPEYWIDFWHQTAANPSLANLTHFVIRLNDVSVRSVEAAVAAVCLRHDLLRGRITVVDGTPRLILDEASRIPVQIVDLSANGGAERGQIEEVLQRVIWLPFDDGSVFRVCAVKTSPTELFVAFVIHHFICDFPSCQIVAREVVSAMRGGEASLARAHERPIQYSDYLSAMNEWLAGPGGRSRLAYWKDKMAGAPVIRLPQRCDGERSDPLPIDSLPFHADESLRAAIARLGTELGVTIASVVLTASFVALWRILQASDLVTTLIASGRDDPALLGLVGATVNLFPVRVNVEPHMSYRHLIAQVREAQLLAQDYQVPWALLMRTLAPPDSGLTAPVFNFIPGRGAAARINSFLDAGAADERPQLRRPAEGEQPSWMSHELNIVDSGSTLSGTVRYSPARYRRDTVQRFIGTLLSSLTEAVHHPQRRIGDRADAAG